MAAMKTWYQTHPYLFHKRPHDIRDMAYHWKRALLHRQNLDRPDGRPLYRYRLSNEEFDELEALLRKWLSIIDSRHDLSDIARQSGFPALFVLYAAEWWRRRYNGSHWSWEPILKAIGANLLQWSHAQRSAYVERGFQEWCLKLSKSGGLRYLGSIAVQGGLPLSLLAQARGGIGQVLSRVLQLAGSSTEADLYALDWVRSLQDKLPKSYREKAIFVLLAEVACIVLRLKEEAHLDSSADAIARLDEKLGPQWRERFPLPIDDHHAQGLIEQLIRDVANKRFERQTARLRLERWIQADKDGSWTLNSRLALPDTLQDVQLADVFGVAKEELPRIAELALSAGAQRQTTATRRLAGRETYRIERKPLGFSGTDTGSEHLLHLDASDGRSWSASVAGSLDEDLPWVFSTEDGRLLRQGSGGVAASEAFLALPPHWHIVSSDHAVSQGTLTEPQRTVFRIDGDIQLVDGEGTNYRIRTGQADAEAEQYEWHGQRYWLDFRQPAMAFKGRPRLYRRNPQGVPHPVADQPSWIPSDHDVGPVTARYPAHGDVKHRARMLILPAEAALVLEGRDPLSGTIRLQNWGVAKARVVTPGIQQRSRHEAGSLILELSLAANVHTPERVEIEAIWPHATARLVLPYPAVGVRAFDGSGKELNAGALLAAHRLAGVRIQVLLGHEQPPVELELTLGGRQRTHRLEGMPGSPVLVIRLQDYAADIQRLLSTNDNPDAEVVAIIRVGAVEQFKLCLARYAARLEKSGGAIGLDRVKGIPIETLASLPVLALRLQRPGDEAIALPSRDSEGVASGMWDFSPEKREPGSWLIYPGVDAALPFRPTLWPVPGEVNADSRLAQAIGIADPDERQAALDQVVAAMAANFLEPCWLEIERLAGQIGYLPLTTLDLWRRLARSPQGMAALALRFGNLPQGFLDRFDQELPFAWETIPFVTWRRAMECLKRQYEEQFGVEKGTNLFSIYLRDRIEDLTAKHGALAYLLGIASSAFLSASKRQVEALKHVGQRALGQLFDGPDSLSMKLRQHHAEDQWPTGFNPILESARSQNVVVRMIRLQTPGYLNGAINLPLLLAAQVATDKTCDWFLQPTFIDVLHIHRDFDPEWFDEAYNLTIAHCLAEGLLDAEGCP